MSPSISSPRETFRKIAANIEAVMKGYPAPLEVDAPFALATLLPVPRFALLGEARQIRSLRGR
jgi:hypothetical protein